MFKSLKHPQHAKQQRNIYTVIVKTVSPPTFEPNTEHAA